MPTYIPIHKRRLDPETGKPVYDENGQQIMDLVNIIEVPDPPVYEPLFEEPIAEESIAEESIAEEVPIDPNDPTLII
jgi:hypothetical protein